MGNFPIVMQYQGEDKMIEEIVTTRFFSNNKIFSLHLAQDAARTPVIQKRATVKEDEQQAVASDTFTFEKCGACLFLATSMDSYGGASEHENACAKCAARFVQRNASETMM